MQRERVMLLRVSVRHAVYYRAAYVATILTIALSLIRKLASLESQGILHVHEPFPEPLGKMILECGNSNDTQ